MKRSRLGVILVYALLIVLSAIMLVPVLVTVSTSLKDLTEVYHEPPTLIPQRICWANYREALTSFPFLKYLANTLIVVAFSITGTLLSCTVVAYGFARFRCRLNRVLFTVMLSTMMLPGIVTSIPTFIMFTRYFGWYDTLYPLWVPSFFAAPFFVFLLTQFFRTLPPDLLDAARIDGCTELGVLWRIVVPLSRPALATVAVFTFMGQWNDYLGPLLYLQDPDKFTLALGLTHFLSGAYREVYGTAWNLMMAASLVVMLPIIVLFFFAQRSFIEGITLTGMKG
ncbi:MAG TPA: carbohydrate ABC transporter permease [Planctomycetota bacterium]|nr:carbohydrate ABC transporter permease [Planctomycetota bacterium]HUW31424.1 carbohydrate ABC transporter permease [Planctomycetota bacterium]